MDGCTTHTAGLMRARWSDEVVMMTGGLPQVGSSEHLATQTPCNTDTLKSSSSSK